MPATHNHEPEDLAWMFERFIARSRDIVAAGGDGVYFFNYCCYWPRLGAEEPDTAAMFTAIRGIAAR